VYYFKKSYPPTQLNKRGLNLCENVGKKLKKLNFKKYKQKKKKKFLAAVSVKLKQKIVQHSYTNIRKINDLSNSLYPAVTSLV